MDPILDRIEAAAGVPDLAAILVERLTPTDLQSLLLEVYRQRASRRTPAELLESYRNDRFVRPARLSPSRQLAWEGTAWSNLPAEFEPMTLSPLAPLGACSVVAPIDQNWAVATARNTEVVSDPTNVLALECALRRKDLLKSSPKSVQTVHLAASQRLVRAQRYQDPESRVHFSAFVLCSAGRDRGNLGFELEALGLQIGFYLRALRIFLGTGVPLQVAFTDFMPEDHRIRLEEDLLEQLRGAAPDVKCGFDPQRTQGRGYYQGLCYHILAQHPDGVWLELADGGVVDWTQRLLSDAKERMVISGIGSERVCTAFEV